MNGKFLMCFLLVVWTFGILADTGHAQPGVASRQIIRDTEMIDLRMPRSRKYVKQKSSGRRKATSKTNAIGSGKQNPVDSKLETYLSYIGIGIEDNLAPSETEGLILNLNYTDLKTGATFKRKYTYDRSAHIFPIHDVTPGKYRLSAELIRQGSIIKTLIGSNNYWVSEKVPFAEAIEVEVMLFNDDGTKSLKTTPEYLKVQIIK